MSGWSRSPGRGAGSLSHGEARAALSDRLDAPLAASRDAALRAHLAECRACREVAADYERIRAELRALPSAPPPRDLTARTLAALDLEVGHVRAPHPTSTFRRRSTTRSGGVALGSLLTVALVAVVGILLAGPVVQIPAPLAGATPFAISPVQLAFVGVENDVVRLYRAQIDRACPAAAPCAGLTAQADQVVDLPHTAAISTLALDPAHHRAAVAAVAAAGGTTSYYVLALDSQATSAPASSLPADLPGVSGSPSPIASSSVRPSTPSRPSASPRRSGSSGTTSAGTARPASTTRPSSPLPSRSPAASRSPVVGPTSSPAVAAASPESSASGAAIGGIVAPDSGAGAGPGAGSAAGGGQSAALVPAQAILEQVIPTGAPAAWSPDGSTLAFSAMPADGATGSDIYVWRPGDAAATPITFDHASSFASWAQTRIVGSTVVPSPADPSVLVPQSFVLDPYTGARRAIRGASLWLPSVDPTAEHVVAWSGTLEMSGVTPVPGSGRLVLASWPQLDPYAAPPSGAPGAPATIIPVPSSSLESMVAGSATHGRGEASTAPADTVSSAAPEAGGSPKAGPSAAPGASVAPATAFLATPEPVDTPAAPSGPRLQEWVVSWAPDGSAFAVWEGTAVGTDTGTLSLHLVDPATGALRPDSPLSVPVAAGRGFSVGLDRLAWTTPADAQGMRSLRVVVWGSFGNGEVRSGQLDQQGIVPAF